MASGFSCSQDSLSLLYCQVKCYNIPMKDDKKIVLYILCGLILSNIVAFYAIWDLGQSQDLEVIFFDVGQGDSIFIETEGRYQILIDGGPDSTILEKLGREMPFYDRTLEMVVLTHPDHDHMAGLLEVLERYNVKYILWTGVIKDTSEFEKWQELIKKEGAEIIIAQSGQKIELGEAYLDILYPLENLEGKESKSINNTSIVCRLVFEDNSFLFTGDIEKSVERELVSSNTDLDSDFLKVAHHGSKTSSCEEFIQSVSPETAVIQCGKDNSYGHPHKEVLEILEKYDITILRTDEQGDIKYGFSNL